MSRKTCKFIVLSVIGICILLFFLRCCMGVLFFENRTSSAPRGIYVRSFGALRYEDYVVVSLDRDVASLKEGSLLLKRVKGFPGDVYVIKDRMLEIRGQMFRLKDIKGLPKLRSGSYIVPDGEVLLINDATDSFDSRYLGPLRRDRVQAKVRILVPYETLFCIFS